MDQFEEITAYQVAVLIFHETSDNIVHPNYAFRAYEVYQVKTGIDTPAYLEMIKSGGHGFSQCHDARKN